MIGTFQFFCPFQIFFPVSSHLFLINSFIVTASPLKRDLTEDPNEPRPKWFLMILLPWWFVIKEFGWQRILGKCRQVFSQFLDLRWSLGNVKEKTARKSCFSREKKRLAPRIYLAKICQATFFWCQRSFYSIFMRNRY